VFLKFMLKRLKQSEGQMVVMMALIFPLFVLLLAFFVNTGLLIHQKIRLQTAADAGVYSATASLARDLNLIASYNRNIQDLYDGNASSAEYVQWTDSLKNQLNGDSFNDKAIIEFFFAQYQNKYHELRDMINETNDAALEKADKIGKAAAALTFYNGNETNANNNPNNFSFKSLYDNADGKMMSYAEFTAEEVASYIKVEESGGNPFDPYAGYCEDCIKKNVNIPIEKISKVAFAGKARAKTGFKNIWESQFKIDSAEYEDGQIVLSTYAAGQPYGGSVKNFMDTYRATLIPIGDYASSETSLTFWH